MKFLKLFGLVGLAVAAGVLLVLLGALLTVRINLERVGSVWEVLSGAGAVVSGVGAFAAALITYAVFKVAHSLQQSLINTETEFLRTLVEQDFRTVFSALRDCYDQFCRLRSINSQDSEFGKISRRTLAGALAGHAQRLDLVFCRTAWNKLHLLPTDLKKSVLDVFECAPALRTYLSTDATSENPKLTSHSIVDFEARIGDLAILLMPVLKMTVESPEMAQLKAAVSQADWMNEPGRLVTEVIERGEGM